MRAVASTADDRQAMALLMLPFLLMATGIGISQSIRNFQHHIDVAAVHAPAIETRVREVPQHQSIAEMPRIEIPQATEPVPVLAPVAALVIPPAEVVQPPLLALREEGDGNLSGPVCMAAAKPRPAAVAAHISNAAGDAATFGLRLAAAARSQIGDLVIYDDTYRTISYPMGDVAPLFGVCTDVVIRAYRALGLDLQALVHLARFGTGDPSIDHRRTEILRRYFAVYGESLPVTPFAEDYLPGDIVTYYRPQNQRAQAHIAVVSDVIAPSGRPMIVHNRGWGPQLEDALFVNQMTGHYRYTGARRPGGADWTEASATTNAAATQASAAQISSEQKLDQTAGASQQDGAHSSGTAPASLASGRF